MEQKKKNEFLNIFSEKLQVWFPLLVRRESFLKNSLKFRVNEKLKLEIFIEIYLHLQFKFYYKGAR